MLSALPPPVLKAIVKVLEGNGVRISMLRCGGGCSIDELVKIFSGAICGGVTLYDGGVARMESMLGAVAVAQRVLGHYNSIDAVGFNKPCLVPCHSYPHRALE